MSFSRAGLVGLALVSGAVSAAGAQDRKLTQWEQVARDLLAELVGYNTSQSGGEMTKAAEAMAARVRAAGFPHPMSWSSSRHRTKAI